MYNVRFYFKEERCLSAKGMVEREFVATNCTEGQGEDRRHGDEEGAEPLARQDKAKGTAVRGYRTD